MPGGHICEEKQMLAWRSKMMKKILQWILVGMMLSVASSCGPTPESPKLGPSPTAPTASPPEAEPETPATGERPPLRLEDGKLYVALIWHHHQPVYYKDPTTGAYERPWVRVHAAKDYLDMAAMLADYPDIHVTFNLTPSLIRQLDEISAGAKDLYWLHAEIPAETLTETQKQFILDRFFDINPKVVARFPRYAELSRMRNANAVAQWTTQDFRDLQVLFNLAWTDPDWLAQEPLAGLVAKGRDFSEEDKAVVFEQHLRLVRQVIPLHAEMQRSGQIEITMTPFAHPILPLLVDSNLARIAMPDADLPSRFVFGQDAVAQVELGVKLYREHFGVEPRGMWPAEGAVAEQIVAMAAKAGLQWMASDEKVLAHSLPDLDGFTRDANDTVVEADILYRPYVVQGARGDPVAILFRDHLISDKVAFEYSGMPGALAAADFIGRLEAIQARLEEQGAPGPHLVTVILDGENAWEHYDNDGKAFLHEMYQRLSQSPTLVTVTPSEYLRALQAREVELRAIETLWAGSWVDGTFSTWIGEQEENQAWEYLRETRQALQQAATELAPDVLEQALLLTYLAEGSDWFWWYGADQNSGVDENFDSQFRSYLEQIYRLMARPVPDFVHVPVIPQRPQPADREPRDLLQIRPDGVASAGEWETAGYYALDEAGLAALHYGFDQENLYLRIDAQEGFQDDIVLGFYLSTPEALAANAYSRYGQGKTLLGFGAKQLIEVSFEGGQPTARVYRADGQGGWAAFDPDAPSLEGVAAKGGMLEIVAPFDRFTAGARSGDRIHGRLVMSRGGNDISLLPPSGPFLATVPDLPIPNVFLEIEDPEHDDYGPGTYLYPKDQVFKPGVFDLIGLTAGYDDEDYIFRFQFRGPVINEWDSPNGLSVQAIDVYLDTNGPGAGERMLLPGRNAALTSDYAWDYAIWAEGWTSGIYTPGDQGPVQIDHGYTIITNPGQRRVTIRVPRGLIPGDPSTWALAVAILSQEGFPAAGVWRVRDVQEQAEQWRIGGGTGSPADTRILDILWPADRQPTQESLLRHGNPADVDIGSLGPDQLPQVPMIAP